MKVAKILTKSERREYQRYCPGCGEASFHTYSLVGEGKEAWQSFRCRRCSTEWAEVYSLHRIETQEDW